MRFDFLYNCASMMESYSQQSVYRIVYSVPICKGNHRYITSSFVVFALIYTGGGGRRRPRTPDRDGIRSCHATLLTDTQSTAIIDSLRGGRNSFPVCTRFSWFWPQNTWALWMILGQVYEILHSFWPQLRTPRFPSIFRREHVYLQFV